MADNRSNPDLPLPAMRVALTALLVFAGCYVGARISSMARFPDVGTAVLFPSYAVLAAALMLTPMRQWWWYVLAAAAGNFWPHLQHERVTSFVLMTETANVVRALVAAWGLRWFGYRARFFDTVHGAVAFLVFAVVLGPATGAFIGALAVTLHNPGADFRIVWGAWLLSNMLTGLTLLPLILILANRAGTWVQRISWARIVEAILLSVVLIAVGAYVFARNHGGSIVPSSLYWPLPLLLWAALRFGPGGTIAALSTLTTLTIAGAMSGHGPFVTHAPAENLIQLQFFLIAMTVPMLLLTAGIDERYTISTALNESQQRFQSVLASLSSGVVVLDRDGRITYTSRSWQNAAILHKASMSKVGVGVSYLEVCRKASVEDPLALQALKAIESVLAERVPRATFEYTCQRPGGECEWFQMLVDAMPPEYGGAVVTHNDITSRHRAEEFARQVLDASPNIIYLNDFEVGVRVFTGRQVTAALGYTPAQILALGNRFCPESVHPDDHASVDAAREQLGRMPDGQVLEHEYRIRTASGEWRWLRTSEIVFARNKDGRPTQLLGIATDVTQRRAMEEALRENEANFRSIFELAGVGCAVGVPPSGRYIRVNRKFCEITGYGEEELLKLAFVDLTHPEDREEDGRKYQALLAGEHDTWQAEKRYVCKDGHIVWVSVNGVLIRDASGQPLHTIANVQDITDRKKAEDALHGALDEVHELKDRLQEENIFLQQELSQVISSGELVCVSEGMRSMMEQVQRVAPTDTTVLILGETGTGKELAARTIHQLSKRKDLPLIRVNCAVLPANLIESELFGHEKGAFTGAASRRVGRFEMADEGSLFLDEIGELPLEVQAKLLRVLQEGEFERLGSSRTMKVNVRIITATNRDLHECVQQRTFRADLYYRLNVFPVWVPPLRFRQEDLPQLVDSLLADSARRLGHAICQVDDSIINELCSHDWPGNVRELENIIERAALSTHGRLLRLPAGWKGAWHREVSPAALETSAQNSQFPRVRLDELERRYIRQILDLTNWRVEGPQGAAEVLGLNPSTLRFRMKKLCISRSSSEDGISERS